MFDPVVEALILRIYGGFKERYDIDVGNVGFDGNHVHVLCRFLPKYSGDQVIFADKEYKLAYAV